MFSINTAYEGLYMWHGQNVYRFRTLLSIGRQKMTSKRMKEKSRQNIDSISRACIHVLKKIVKRDWGKSGRRTVVVRNTDIELLLCGIPPLNCCCAEYRHWTVVRKTDIEPLLCGIPTLNRCCAEYRHWTVVVRNTDIELLLCGIPTLNCCCAEYWHWTAVVRNTDIELLLCGIPALNYCCAEYRHWKGRRLRVYEDKVTKFPKR